MSCFAVCAGPAIFSLRVSTNRRALPTRLATRVFLYHYDRLFARTFGETPHEFLTRVRIDRAKELLAREQLPVTDVCLEAERPALQYCEKRRKNSGRARLANSPFAPVAQLDRASGYEPEGRVFESLRAHHKFPSFLAGLIGIRRSSSESDPQGK